MHARAERRNAPCVQNSAQSSCCLGRRTAAPSRALPPPGSPTHQNQLERKAALHQPPPSPEPPWIPFVCAHPPGQQKRSPTGSSIQARAYAVRVLARVRTRASTERELSSSRIRLSLHSLFSDHLSAPADSETSQAKDIAALHHLGRTSRRVAWRAARIVSRTPSLMAGRSNTPKNVPQNDTVHPIEEIRRC